MMNPEMEPGAADYKPEVHATPEFKAVADEVIDRMDQIMDDKVAAAEAMKNLDRMADEDREKAA